MDSIIVHQASKTGFVSKGALIALGMNASFIFIMKESTLHVGKLQHRVCRILSAHPVSACFV